MSLDGDGLIESQALDFHLRTRRWVIAAASGREAALAFAEARGLQSSAVLGKKDLLARPGDLRAAVRAIGANAALVHSLDWPRQCNPQLYELALAVMPVRERYIADQRSGSLRHVGSARATLGLARIPVDGVGAASAIGREALRLLPERRSRLRPPVSPGPADSNGRRSILALWRGNLESYGGSITHIAGILHGFRECGYRTALLTCFEPPSVLTSIADEIEVLPPLPPSRRVNGDTEQLSWNEPLRRAGLQLAERIRPAFVYQRHSAFLTAGAAVAESANVPLVLEWNGSEPWIREHWEAQWRVERFLDPLLEAMERMVVSRSTLLVAVSRDAAEMALQVGAAPDQTMVVPNAVDIGFVDRSLNGAAGTVDRPSGTLLGWAGSFGPWHGAEVVVTALARLPQDVRLVMVGDGVERAACQQLAASLGVGDRVEWTGSLPRPVALKTLAGCDLLVSPHTPLAGQPFFGSPTKLFEYMALGRPIVASRLGQIGEVLEDGVTARLVAPGDVDDLVQGILSVLLLPDRGRQLGEAARREAAAGHTWDIRARAVLDRLELPVVGSANGA
jgi:glycosyltransferase involved in cell wall biosynthesis